MQEIFWYPTHQQNVALTTREWCERFSKAKKVTAPMTLDESRKEFPYRPFMTKKEHGISVESRFGGTTHGDIELMKSNSWEPCKMCSAPTEKIWLSGVGICPDCDGRAAANGFNPHSKPR